MSKMVEIQKDADGYSYYLFKPSLFCQYYQGEDETQIPPHRRMLTHKLHMLLYFLGGGYQILYLKKDGQVVGYIAFTRVKKWIVRNATKKGLYTIFIYTYPKFRGQGIANRMLNCLLKGDVFNFTYSYKTIGIKNIASIKVAEKIGYKFQAYARKTKFLKTIYQVNKSNTLLYVYCKSANAQETEKGKEIREE